MRRKGKILFVLSVAMTTLLGSALQVSAAPSYTDIFDADYYGAKYSDVAEAFGDDEEALYNHYVNYGIYEGRIGSEAFNVISYRENYADLNAAFGNDWKSYADHYLTQGLAEGRDSGGIFDAVSYANRYNDLKEAFGYDVTKLWDHYNQFGVHEGRNAISQTVLNRWAEEARIAAQNETQNDSQNESENESINDNQTEAETPLTLSGNADDVYTMTKPEYVETDKFILFLDEGIQVNGNIVELIEKLMLMTEEESGLTLTNDIGFKPCYNVFTPGEFFGEGTFANIDPMNEKFHIFVVPYEKYGACGTSGSIVLNQVDMDIEGGEGWTLVHEYTHALHYANGIDLSSKMTEGWATYICGQVTSKESDIPFNFNANYNYSNYDEEITRENAETIFLTQPEDGWEDYLYGYRFMTFLAEKYGKQVFIDILTDATLDAGEWEYGYEAEKVVPYIKANTSDDVFGEFGDWLEANKERIEAWMNEY